jgi:hypothetical protein
MDNSRKHMPPPDEAGTLSTTEARISRIWADFLDGEMALPETDFFAAGGSSLSATQAASRIRQEFARDLPFDALFVHPVLRDLAAAVDHAAQLLPHRIVPAPGGGRVPASAAQKRVLFHAQLADDSTAYNVSWAYRAVGAPSEEALRSALEDVIARHDALRSIFVEDDDGMPVLEVLGECSPGYFAVLDEQPAGLPAAIERARRVEFELDSGPLHRTTLIRLPHEEFVLLFTSHHAISDAWSEDIMRRDLTAAYRARARGDAVRWPELPLGYRDFAYWQAESLNNGEFEAQRRYWAAELRDAPEGLSLPLKQPRSPIPDSAADSLTVAIDARVSARLRSIASTEKVTPFVLLLTLFGLSLREISRESDLVVGVPANGRTVPELEQLVGFFVNSLPIRLRFAEGARPGELLQMVKKTVLTALSQQELPFDEIVRVAGPPRVAGRNPLFQVWFVFDDPSVELRLPGLRLERLCLPELTVRFDLALHVRDEGDRFTGVLTYRHSLFEQEVVARIADGVRRAAEMLAFTDDFGEKMGKTS